MAECIDCQAENDPTGPGFVFFHPNRPSRKNPRPAPFPGPRCKRHHRKNRKGSCHE